MKPALIGVLFARLACAQVNASELTGVVADSQGNRIPEVVVRVSQTATGLTRDTKTNSQGIYLLSNLPVGIYTMDFSRRGFAPARLGNIFQTVGETRTVNATLEVARGRAETTIREPLIQL